VKILLDLLPLLVFFGVFRVARWTPQASTALVTGWVGALDGTPDQQAELCAFILATVSTIFATVGQISVLLARRQAIKPAVWISAAVVLVFGGLTIWFHNEWFLKWKPSILYWIFALVLLGGKWLLRRNFLGSLITQEMELTLPARVEDNILYAWSAFFVALGAFNLFVAYRWSTESWVNFKTFGAMGLILAFSVGTGVFLARYLPPAKPSGQLPNEK
jgi:intracellular septation protein